MKAVRALNLWSILSGVGTSIYVALYLLDAPVPRWSQGIPAVLLFALAAALLLVADEDAAVASKHNGAEMTFASLLYALLTTRKSLLALLLLMLIGTGFGTYYVVSSLVHVERQNAGLVIQLASETVTFQPIHPYGWQSTGIALKKGQRLAAELWGSVSPGFIVNYRKIEEYMKAYKAWTERPTGPIPPKPELDWPYSGPEGYRETYYQPGAHWVEDYRTANSLTVRGLRHNVVVGVVLDGTESPCRIHLPVGKSRHDGSSEPAPCVAGFVKEKAMSVSYPGYDWEVDKKGERRLLNLSALAESAGTYEVPRDGKLWVTINDSDEFRFDNTGFFFMKLTIGRR